MNKILTILLMGISISLFSEPLIVDEKRAVELALLNNLDLKKQELSRESALLDKKSSYNAFYPKVGVNGAIAHSNTDPKPIIAFNPLKGQHDIYVMDPTNLALSMDASLYLTPAIIDGIKLLNSNYYLEEIKTEKQKQSVIRDIKKSFYTLVVLKEQIKLLEYNYDELERRYNQVKKNYESGYVDELTLLEVQVALENFKPQLTNLNELYNISLKNFKNSIGVDQAIEVIIDGSIEVDNITYIKDDLLEKALTEGHDMAILNKNIQLLDQQLSLKKSTAFFPVLGFSYSMKTGLNDPSNNDIFDPDNYSDDQGNFNIFLSMNLTPLLPNSKERVEIEKLKNSREIALLGKSQLSDGLDLQLTQKIQTLDNSLKLQESLKRTVSLAQKRLNLTKEAYKLGSKELLEVEKAENELRKAQLELLREKHNYLSAIFDIEFIIGKGE